MEIQLPRSVDRARLLEPLQAVVEDGNGGWIFRWQVDSEYRIRITRKSPLRFMLVYLSHLLQGANTRGVHSMSQLHIDMGKAALRWTDDQRAVRDAWVAPRGAAKSTWCMGLVLWALAHRWRRTVLLYSDTNEQIRVHMGDLRRELERNDLIREDFPDLIPDRRRRGAVDTTFMIVSPDGRSVSARSMGTSDLGHKVAGGRPDLVILDDVEPDSPTERDKAVRLEKITNVVLPMNPHAAIVLVGTVTGWGSMAHDVVRAATGDGEPASWIAGPGFRPRYYPALWRTGDTESGGVERSLWPAAWSVPWLRNLREHEPDNFRLNYLGQPAEPGGEHWTAQTFRYRSWPTVGDIVHVDPAVTVTPSSDETAVCVVGQASSASPAPGTSVVRYCRGRRVTGSQIRTWLIRLLTENPHITTVVLEENAGGDWAEILLRPRRDGRDTWPRAVRLVLYRAFEAKRDRIHTLEGRYERVEVVHAREFDLLERQMIRYPNPNDHDDLVDTVAGGVEYLRNPHRMVGSGASAHPLYRVVNPDDYRALGPAA